jgi:putative acetyltransferase
MSPQIDVSPTTPDDALGAYTVLAAAFGSTTEADLVVRLFQDDAVVLSLVAHVDGVVVGTCVFSRVTLETGAGEQSAVCLAPIAVAPPVQRSGVGSALIHEGLSLLKLAGETFVLVLGDPSYYGRFGFTADAAASVETPWDGPYQQSLVLAGDPPGPSRAAYPKAFAALP